MDKLREILIRFQGDMCVDATDCDKCDQNREYCDAMTDCINAIAKYYIPCSEAVRWSNVERIFREQKNYIGSRDNYVWQQAIDTFFMCLAQLRAKEGGK